MPAVVSSQPDQTSAMECSQEASIQFIRWQQLYEREKPFQIFQDISPEAKDQRTTNLVFQDKNVVIEDIRNRQDTLSLDSNGFIVKNLAGFLDLTSQEAVTAEYLPAIEKLIKEEVEGADRVAFYDWRLRDVLAEPTNGFINLVNGLEPLRPANFAHVDLAPSSALNLANKEHCSDSASNSNGRLRVINIWKPLRHQVEDWPLAICDGATVEFGDLVPTDTIRATSVGMNMYAMHSDKQNWCYLSQQKPDEVLIFKQFDSKPNIRSSLTLHAAFQSRTASATVPARRSIEVRALVYTEANV